MRKSLSIEERLESLKAGLATGVAAAVAEGLFQSIQVYFWPNASAVWTAGAVFDLVFWCSLAIAGLSGFLFGVTCRYVIRQDNNPHLASGAVFAFGLVRGLAQVQLAEATLQDLALALFAIAESLGIFTVAYLALSVSLRRGWIKPPF